VAFWTLDALEEEEVLLSWLLLLFPSDSVATGSERELVSLKNLP